MRGGGGGRRGESESEREGGRGRDRGEGGFDEKYVFYLFSIFFVDESIVPAVVSMQATLGSHAQVHCRTAGNSFYF